MDYIICEECGGYYELQSGESADDFENCQCGGNLKLVEDSFLMPEPEIKARFVCSNCLEENEAGLYCSKCGGRLISINNKNNETKSEMSYDMDHIERLARNSKNASSNKYNTNITSSKDLKNFLDRIIWLGVICGLGFYIVSNVVTAFIIYFLFLSNESFFSMSIYSISPSVLFILILYLVINCILGIISGALSVFISKKTEYIDGLINGALVGIFSAIILGIASGSGFLVSIFISGGFTAIGGLIVIFIRNKGYLNNKSE